MRKNHKINFIEIVEIADAAVADDETADVAGVVDVACVADVVVVDDAAAVDVVDAVAVAVVVVVESLVAQNQVEIDHHRNWAVVEILQNPKKKKLKNSKSIFINTYVEVHQEASCFAANKQVTKIEKKNIQILLALEQIPLVQTTPLELALSEEALQRYRLKFFFHNFFFYRKN